jgi:hypothetical protein
MSKYWSILLTRFSLDKLVVYLRAAFQKVRVKVVLGHDGFMDTFAE